MAITRRNLLQILGLSAVSGASLRLNGFPLLEDSQVPGNASASGFSLLDRNENAYGPSQNVLAAVRKSLLEVNRYPRKEYDSLRDKIAALHKVRPEQVVLSCGSSEILRMASAAFLAPRKKLLMASPTYPVIASSARSVGAQSLEIPINASYHHDLDAMLARTDSSVGLVYICNPNNPTGTLTPRVDIEAFIRKLPSKVMVVIDEAYHHFAGDSSAYVSFVDHPLDDDRVIVTRTFSKVHGLAGMRVGYAVAKLETARRLSRDLAASGLSTAALTAAAAALDDSEYLRLAIERNANDRQEFRNQAGARQLRVLDSYTNFVFVNTMQVASDVFGHLEKHKILVAPPFPAMPKYLRVSLGIEAQMREFWRVWDLMPHHPMVM